ncbi:YciI family protein [Leptospira stimsonii]|uniref:Transcription initiation protein n=1 Tax=Leptospira stimsonii TaxID=2202203 RepID=A0A4R9L7J0_9LEPT|nr:YciI family protein [Leptospira stimsonii]RHX83529.1 transcription initiation protein [Leptospira stimsonii]TGK20408.1 transcription initiation protein [Leptospira stimsonii]TGM21519.1 transcription initiation protein [Leptospira stimsonii]
MDEYLILMRLDLISKDAQPSPQQLEVYMKQYHDWVEGIVLRKKFLGGTGLSTEGKVIKPNQVISEGPFVEIKESLAGFITILADNFEDAVSIAKECPILGGDGNSVEVRRIVSVHEKD